MGINIFKKEMLRILKNQLRAVAGNHPTSVRHGSKGLLWLLQTLWGRNTKTEILGWNNFNWFYRFMFWIIKYSSDKLNGIKNILFESSRPKKVNSSSFLEALDLSLSIVNTSLLQSNFNPQNLPYQEPQVEHLVWACKNKWSKKVWVGQFNWPPVIYCCWFAYNIFLRDIFAKIAPKTLQRMWPSFVNVKLDTYFSAAFIACQLCRVRGEI